jgi:hypothetical protein
VIIIDINKKPFPAEETDFDAVWGGFIAPYGIKICFSRKE